MDRRETNVTYANMVQPVQDFPKATENKTIPKSVTTEASTKSELLMIELINMMKEQNKNMMEMMLSMKQTQMNSLAQPSQS